MGAVLVVGHICLGHLSDRCRPWGSDLNEVKFGTWQTLNVGLVKGQTWRDELKVNRHGIDRLLFIPLTYSPANYYCTFDFKK